MVLGGSASESEFLFLSAGCVGPGKRVGSSHDLSAPSETFYKQNKMTLECTMSIYMLSLSLSLSLSLALSLKVPPTGHAWCIIMWTVCDANHVMCRPHVGICSHEALKAPIKGPPFAHRN